MDNEDERRTPTKLERDEPPLAPRDAFLRALLKLQAALDALGAALAAEDADEFEAGAAEAFSFLLTAISLFRRMESAAEPDQRRIDTAWFAVRTHHRALLDLFMRATTQLASADLRVRIEQHRISLTLAIAGLGPRSQKSGT